MRRVDAAEQMDAADLDPAVYAAVLNDLARVNRLTLAARPTLDFVARAVGERRSFSLLDVGFGDGGMLRAIAGWAKARGIEARLTGVDLNPNSAAVARARAPADLEIDWHTGDYATLGQFDLIVSSLVAHHMTRAELVAFLRHMEAKARLGWLVNDLHRHRLAALGYPVLAALARAHPIVRHDGALSIRRSFVREDWLELLDEAGARHSRVRRVFPFRLCVERLR